MATLKYYNGNNWVPLTNPGTMVYITEYTETPANGSVYIVQEDNKPTGFYKDESIIYYDGSWRQLSKQYTGSDTISISNDGEISCTIDNTNAINNARTIVEASNGIKVEKTKTSPDEYTVSTSVVLKDTATETLNYITDKDGNNTKYVRPNSTITTKNFVSNVSVENGEDYISQQKTTLNAQVIIDALGYTPAERAEDQEQISAYFYVTTADSITLGPVTTQSFTSTGQALQFTGSASLSYRAPMYSTGGGTINGLYFYFPGDTPSTNSVASSVQQISDDAQFIITTDENLYNNFTSTKNNFISSEISEENPKTLIYDQGNQVVMMAPMYSIGTGFLSGLFLLSS